jgi:hypothetical protein
MAKRSRRPENDTHDSGQHAAQLRELLAKTVRQVRHDIGKASDPKTHALFETTAAVLDGLIRACDQVEQPSEPAWM